MRRDLDLVRSILIYVENADSEVDAGNMAAKRWSIESVAYHVGLCRVPRMRGDDPNIGVCQNQMPTISRKDIVQASSCEGAV